MKLKRIEEYNDGAILEYRTPGAKNKKKLGPNSDIDAQTKSSGLRF